MVVPLLLVFVASTQVLVANTTTLTPWRGGGFGMFATVDAHSHRIVRVESELDRGEPVPLDVLSFRRVASVERAFVSARAWPTDRRLDRLAAALTEVPAVLDDGVIRPVAAAPSAGSVDPTTVDLGGGVLTISVAGIEFDPGSGQVVPVSLASRSVRP